MTTGAVMESIEVELSDFALRRRSVVVSHLAAELPRGLEPGEQLLLHDRAHGYYTGHVADIDFELADTVYRLQVGVRLTRDEARERLHSATAPLGARSSGDEVLDLLGRLRGDSASRPARSAPTAGRRSGTAR